MTDRPKHTPGPWNRDISSIINAANGIQSHYQGESWKCKDGEFQKISECNAALIAAAPELLEALEHIVSDIKALISESEGVIGLHLNGDIAEWSSLTKGGRFETWLLSIDGAMEVIAKAKGIPR